MNETEPRRAHRSGLAIGQGHTIAQNVTLVRTIKASKNADQGLFSRPILAHERMNLTRAQIEIYPIQGRYRTKSAR